MCVAHLHKLWIPNPFFFSFVSHFIRSGCHRGTHTKQTLIEIKPIYLIQLFVKPNGKNEPSHPNFISVHIYRCAVFIHSCLQIVENARAVIKSQNRFSPFEQIIMVAEVAVPTLHSWVSHSNEMVLSAENFHDDTIYVGYDALNALLRFSASVRRTWFCQQQRKTLSKYKSIT